MGGESVQAQEEDDAAPPPGNTYPVSFTFPCSPSKLGQPASSKETIETKRAVQALTPQHRLRSNKGTWT